ncbi:MAG: pyridoxamine 5'-phosphate oxidase family protein [Actinomycetota bacterium]
MATWDDVRAMASTETGLCVVSLVRADGSPHASVVNAGPYAHPVTGADTVALVARGGSVKVKRAAAGARLSVTFRRGWQWAGVEGPAEVIGPDHPLDGVDVATVLRDVFTACGGTHDDWDEYDRVMLEDRRAAILVTPERILGVP